VARLIVVNGPPGCGKSTLAERYVDEHPLSLNLDIDRVRGLIGGWQADPLAAGLLARACALAAARTHLAAGHDVVIPQFLGQAQFIEQCADLAGEVGAEFYEIVLLDTLVNSLRRFETRSREAADPAHVQAQELLDSTGGTAEFSLMYDRLLAIVASRPTAKVVRTRAGQADEAYREFLAQLS
jgi:predicted kinase